MPRDSVKNAGENLSMVLEGLKEERTSPICTGATAFVRRSCT
jgi:hypothetical protein